MVPFSIAEMVARLMPSEAARSACVRPAVRRASRMVEPMVFMCIVYSATGVTDYVLHYIRCIILLQRGLLLGYSASPPGPQAGTETEGLATAWSVRWFRAPRRAR